MTPMLSLNTTLDSWSLSLRKLLEPMLNGEVIGYINNIVFLKAICPIQAVNQSESLQAKEELISKPWKTTMIQE